MSDKPNTNLETVTEKLQGVRISDMSKDELMELFGAIAEQAADNALNSVGLSDPEALNDVRDIRDLLRGYRIVRKGALQKLGSIIVWVIVLSIMGLMHNHKTTAELVKLVAGSGG